MGGEWRSHELRARARPSKRFATFAQARANQRGQSHEHGDQASVVGLRCLRAATLSLPVMLDRDWYQDMSA